MDEALLAKADRSGCVSGSKEDKSELFVYSISEAGVPMITDAPVVMECSVEDIYETKGFDNFICTIDNTYAEENVLTKDGKLDYRTLKPVLFEMPTYEYLKTGDVLAKCMELWQGNKGLNSARLFEIYFKRRAAQKVFLSIQPNQVQKTED